MVGLFLFRGYLPTVFCHCESREAVCGRSALLDLQIPGGLLLSLKEGNKVFYLFVRSFSLCTEMQSHRLEAIQRIASSSFTFFHVSIWRGAISYSRDTLTQKSINQQRFCIPSLLLLFFSLTCGNLLFTDSVLSDRFRSSYE